MFLGFLFLSFPIPKRNWLSKYFCGLVCVFVMLVLARVCVFVYKMYIKSIFVVK